MPQVIDKLIKLLKDVYMEIEVLKSRWIVKDGKEIKSSHCYKKDANKAAEKLEKQKISPPLEKKYSRTEISKSLGVNTGILYSVTYGMQIPWEEDENYQYWITETEYKKWFPIMKQKIEKYRKDRATSAKTRSSLKKNPRYHLDKQKAYAAQGMRYKLPDWVIEWQKNQK